jgi:hypothetical protein
MLCLRCGIELEIWCNGVVASAEDRCDVESIEPSRPWTYQPLSITYLRFSTMPITRNSCSIQSPDTTRAEVLKVEVGSRSFWETEHSVLKPEAERTDTRSQAQRT